MLAALIVEDQGGEFAQSRLGTWVDSFIGMESITVKGRKSFFTSELASELLLKIEADFSHFEQLDSSVEMPVSPRLKKVFSCADILRKSLQQEQVQPLHFLADALTDDSARATLIFKDAGITRKKVLKDLRNDVS